MLSTVGSGVVAAFAIETEEQTDPLSAVVIPSSYFFTTEAVYHGAARRADDVSSSIRFNLYLD
ncbi:hypothetical protein PILCRDRAFT_578862 [Piloderma croceum F 1598]|uniref:Uncharacterized protein n=1 Tax=Piloderma croceum (strain F 1598) TaxID=765440 RepID=A0A0C3FGD2_PILCF|nr:hypothetical protein PILCRDRAFT_578862 [Piloderma croceum F 1598]